MPSPDSINEQSARSVVESGRTEKSKLAHVGGNPQRSDVAHPIYGIVPVSFDLSVRFRTALVLTPGWRQSPPNACWKSAAAGPHPSAGHSRSGLRSGLGGAAGKRGSVRPLGIGK
ncbi:hypothetical protein CFBP6625_26335 (plasmid) [Agrobacterium tumefaciens]|nr:hypothetical protein CFBP6625_26335 [Agrobacterium tumefaciens]